MEMGRLFLVTVYIGVSLTMQTLSFVHFEDMFSKPSEKLKGTEKNWKNCQHPGPIRNGQTVVWGDGLLLEFICDKNFFAAGLTHGACDPSTGKWTISPPVCVASGCPDLLPPAHGVLNIDNNGGVATITCEAGYYIIGSHKLYCEGGSWRGRFPFCAVSAKVRPTKPPTSGISNSALRHADESCFQYQIEPPTLPNAVLKTSYVFSKYRSRYVMIATYSCVGGYKLVDPSSSTLYCHNSQWGATVTPKCSLEDDPCQNGNGGCTHICVSRIGRFSCTCRDGYTLGSDFRSCFDLNECVLDNGECEQDCHNTVGSYFCACSPGFVAKGKICVDIDECQGDHKCPGPCINQAGSYKCNCTIRGYSPSSADHFCQDVDECSVNNGGCDDICVNRRGSYECRCEQKGLRLSDDLHSCVDFDECLRYGEKLCRHGRCINLVGSFRCECENGFEARQDGTACVDTDECLLGNGGCDDRCENQFGYFNCYCDEDGYILGEDGLSCEDIDECAITADECEDLCVNIPGSYMCECRQDGMVVASDNISCTECGWDQYYKKSDGHCHNCPDHSVVSSRLRARFALSPTDCECLPGFDGNPRYNIPCVDRNECALQEIRCVHGCVNLPGSAQCSCLAGYSSDADKIHCQDIDECAVSSGGCNHLCINTAGSYSCECDGDGYIMLDDGHTCQDINECENQNYCSHGCENVEGSVACLCPKGHKLHLDLRTCVDVDECTQYESPCAQICINKPATFECDCRVGFKLSWDKRTCIDVNECMEGESVCHEECVNTVGSFKCLCKKKGYTTSSDGYSCIDIDECVENRNKSLCEQKCLNVPGSYRCGCYPGYRKGSSTKCIPCQRGYYRSLKDVGCQRCPPYSSTNNIARTSIGDCKCRRGYYGNLAFNVPCTDINECERDNFGCSDQCVNTDGSAYCLCLKGFNLGPDRKTCVDIDECSTDNDCEQNCVNTIGSYVCGCDLRYFTVGTNIKTCLDINECDTDNFGCSHHCINTIGSAHCSCPIGYQLTDDGKGCKDTDECLEENGGCDHVCVNSIGSYHCECNKAGFEKYLYDDKKCVDINECIKFAPCGDICKNTYGSFKCRCRGQGLKLASDGRTCLDINECATNKICHHKCVNLRGSYRCECDPGYYASGKRCEECQVGAYSSESSNKRSCSHCPAKSMTKQRGSTSISQCVCAPGFKGNPAKGITCTDIDECEKDNGGCEHRCINSPGSFSCACRVSYTLQDDKKSCSVVACPTLKPLSNGSIWPPACTSPASRRKLKKGAICTFRCGRGYDLSGHRYSVCQANSTWTASQPTCEAKYCDGLKEPENGKVNPSICLADFVAFRQRCSYSCNKGFTLIGKPATKCKANQSWSIRKVPRCVPENTSARGENDV